MSLAAIVTKAYTVFNYPRPSTVTNVCTDCCVTAEDARKLLTLPLKEIPVELINEYNDHAQALDYNMNEFKYFLPRYLELISRFEFPSAIDTSLSLKNLNFENDSYWSKEIEKEVLLDFAKAFVTECFSSESFPEDETLTSILNMFYTAQIPIQPLLDIWKANLNEKGMLIISELTLNDINSRGTKITCGFVSEELSAILLNWIRENKNDFMRFIEEYIMNAKKEEGLQKLSYCYDFLKHF
ncbi:hypothetical protein [Flavobacterium pedocola]